ncbi:MAG TPA: DNA-formamidopyrimidine glycosylase [Patescibacteria group bacterium]|nr:DNA-formamidopyrimidine glycosylase [Patescibacteria group bacterium]
MPELPEVETIRRDLETRITGEKISRVQVKDPKAIKGSPDFVKKTTGRTVRGIDRKGKILILELDGGSYVLIHLKMTGQLIYCHNREMIAGGHTFHRESLLEDVGGKLPNQHTRVIFHFQSGDRLFFNDMRRFGYIKFASEREKENKIGELGPEPLLREFDLPSFRKNLKNRKTAIKKVLLDQKLVAGIGNIYADESLFLSGIRPDRLAHELKPEEVRVLHGNIKKVLKKGVKHRGTTFNNYVDSQGKQGGFSEFLQVYGREGEKCPACGGPIKKIRLAGRGTHFCPHCQR